MQDGQLERDDRSDDVILNSAVLLDSLSADYESMTRPERRILRERYRKAQGDKCLHCGEPLTGDPSEEVRKLEVDWRRFPPEFLKYPVHLHHSHETGMTIGAIHALCDAVLWQYHGE